MIEALCDFDFTLLKTTVGSSARFVEHWALLLYCAVHIYDLQFNLSHGAFYFVKLLVLFVNNAIPKFQE